MRRLFGRDWYALAAAAGLLAFAFQGSMRDAQEPPERPPLRYVDATMPMPLVLGRASFLAERKVAGRIYTGTAFATQIPDVWATARHVAEDCKRTVLGHRGGNEGPSTDVAAVVHSRWTDLSLLYAPSTRGSAPALGDILPLEDEALHGFGMGFPSGRRASVHFGYLGRMLAGVEYDQRMRWAPAGAWQILRTGLFDEPDLRGLSGGPLFDREGGLLGIVVGGQPRRARALALDPVNLTALFAAAGERASERGRRQDIDTSNANEVRERMIRNRRLAQVICYS